jgi:hypothetical protein
MIIVLLTRLKLSHWISPPPPDPLFFWIIACAALHPIFRRRVIYIVTLCIKIDEYWSSLHVKIRKLAK